MTRKKNFVYVFFIKSFGFIFFLCLSLLFFYYELQKKNGEIHQQRVEIERLGNEREVAQKTNEELSLIVNSQNDPEWVELVLLKELGLVPEGKIKVHFTNQE